MWTVKKVGHYDRPMLPVFLVRSDSDINNMAEGDIAWHSLIQISMHVIKSNPGNILGFNNLKLKRKKKSMESWNVVFNLLRQKRIQSNSSPLDELGEGAYESGWWCQVKCEHRAGHTGIHGNPESGNHHQAPSHSVEILTNLYTYHGQPRGREGEERTATKMYNYELKIARLPEQVRVM